MKERTVQGRSSLLVAACAVLALAGAVTVSITEGGDWQEGLALWLTRGTGWCALGALMLALSATPAGRIARGLRAPPVFTRRVAAMRRAFGITAAGLALLHAGIALGGYLDGSWQAVISWPYLRAGLSALLILVPLLLTSFPALVRRLRVRLWKPLHRLAYVAALLALEHVLLSPFAPRALTLTLFAALLVLTLGRFVPARAAAPNA